MIQVNTVKKMIQKGKTVLPGDRFPYVVIAGKGRLCDRGENPMLVEEQALKVDTLFYLDVQLRSSLDSVLIFYTPIRRNVTVILDRLTSRLKSSHSGVSNLFDLAKKRSLEE